MNRVRVKSPYILLLAAIILLGGILVLTGRLPQAYTAFKGNMEEQKVSRQLLEPYSVMNGTFSFELPEAWSTNEMSFPGGEVLYHLNFMSKDKRVHGFVQVWKLSEPLKSFVEKSKEAAVGAVDFKYFDIREIMVDNKKGYLLDYSRSNTEGEFYRAYEAFIEGYSNKVYRMSFFVLEKEWRNYYKPLFDRIIRTMKINMR